MRKKVRVKAGKKDNEIARELTGLDTKKTLENLDVHQLANNPRPKYEIYPGE